VTVRGSSAEEHRRAEDGRPLRVLVGKERFSENHAWSEMPLHWPSRVADRAVIEVVGQGRLEARLVDGGPPVDVVVPLWSPLPGRAIRAGGFGLIQQFGVGVDNIDLDAAGYGPQDGVVDKGRLAGLLTGRDDDRAGGRSGCRRPRRRRRRPPCRREEQRHGVLPHQ